LSTDPKSDRMRIFNYFNFTIDPLTWSQDKDGNPNHQELFSSVSHWLSNDPKLNNMVSELSLAFKDREDDYTFYVKMNRDNAFLFYKWLKEVFEKEGKNEYAGTFRLDSHEVLKKDVHE